MTTGYSKEGGFSVEGGLQVGAIKVGGTWSEEAGWGASAGVTVGGVTVGANWNENGGWGYSAGVTVGGATVGANWSESGGWGANVGYDTGSGTVNVGYNENTGYTLTQGVKGTLASDYGNLDVNSTNTFSFDTDGNFTGATTNVTTDVKINENQLKNIDSVVESIKETIGDAIDSVLPEDAPAQAPFPNEASENNPGETNHRLTKELEDFFSGLADAAKELKKESEELGKTIDGALNEAVDTVVDGVVGLAQDAWTGITELADSVADAAGKAWTALTEDDEEIPYGPQGTLLAYNTYGMGGGSSAFPGLWGMDPTVMSDSPTMFDETMYSAIIKDDGTLDGNTWEQLSTEEKLQLLSTIVNSGKKLEDVLTPETEHELLTMLKENITTESGNLMNKVDGSQENGGITQSDALAMALGIARGTGMDAAQYYFGDEVDGLVSNLDDWYENAPTEERIAIGAVGAIWAAMALNAGRIIVEDFGIEGTQKTGPVTVTHDNKEGWSGSVEHTFPDGTTVKVASENGDVSFEESIKVNEQVKINVGVGSDRNRISGTVEKDDLTIDFEAEKETVRDKETGEKKGEKTTVSTTATYDVEFPKIDTTGTIGGTWTEVKTPGSDWQSEQSIWMNFNMPGNGENRVDVNVKYTNTYNEERKKKEQTVEIKASTGF